MKLLKSVKLILSLVILLIIAVQGIVVPESHAVGLSLSGFGTATIDGIFSSAEWARAGSVAFLVNLPEGGTTPGTIFAMNDTKNLYLAIRFARTFVDPGNSADFEFDNNHNGVQDNGEDVLLITPSGFFDEFRSNQPPCPPGSVCGFVDTSFGGTNDGAGAFGNDGTFSVYEFSHPLKSGDIAHDFSLAQGDTVGFTAFIRIINADNTIADTVFPSNPCCPNNFGDIVIASPVPEPSALLLMLVGLGQSV